MNERDEALAIDELLGDSGVKTHKISMDEEQRLTSIARGVLDDAGWPTSDADEWPDMISAFSDAVHDAETDNDESEDHRPVEWE